MAERWTDDRIDDLATTINRRLERLERISETVTSLPAKIDELAQDTSDCRTGVHGLREAFSARAEERARERIAALQQAEQDMRDKAAEKKKDRRWQITTLLAVAALILTGVGILLSVLT